MIAFILLRILLEKFLMIPLSGKVRTKETVHQNFIRNV